MNSEKANRTSARVFHCAIVASLLATVLLASSHDSLAQSLVNRKAPHFVRHDLTGQSIDTAQLKGKVVLLNFWATWCPPCQIEMPMFSRWQKQYAPRGLEVIGISMDDDTSPVRKLVNALSIDYPIALGDAALGKRYGGVLGLPLTFLIDRKGIVRSRFQGETDPRKIEASLQTLMAGR